MREEFATALRFYRERTKCSRNKLAHTVGIDPSYLTRIEHGDREPPRLHIVEALSRALDLSKGDRDRLMVAAGFAPVSVLQLGAWDDALEAVVDVLTDIHLSPEDRDQFRSVVQMLSAKWRAGAQLGASETAS